MGKGELSSRNSRMTSIVLAVIVRQTFFASVLGDLAVIKLQRPTLLGEGTQYVAPT